MSANQNPIFPITPNVGMGKVLTANTALDGTGTVTTVFTAGANGSRVDTINLWHLGTNVVTVIRIFVNNGQTNATATNNSLWWEATMAANTISQVAASVPQGINANLVLPAGYTLIATTGTTIAAGVMISVQGGNY